MCQGHYDAILKTRYILQKYTEIEDLMLILGSDELDAESKTIAKKGFQLQKFLSQNFYMTEHFTFKSGV
ncbi:F0F1 ATP synthase subunit beta, partial [Mycoplasmopsis synoviae]